MMRLNARTIGAVGVGLCLATATVGCGELDPLGDESGDDESVFTDDGEGDGNGSSSDGDETVSSNGWTQVESPAQKADITAVYFHDDKRGWLSTTGDKMVAERGAWFTDNGGQSWEWRRREFDAYVTKYDANGERAWMGGSDRRELWYTDDNKDFKPKDGGLEQQDWISDVYFWNKQVGLAVSQTGERIHRTTDGGETFKQYEFDREIVAGVNDLEVLGDEVWASTGVDFNSDGTGGYVLYSDDRGKNWETIEFTDDAHHYKGGAIQAVHAVSSDVIWAAGSNRQLFVTRNGMDSWQQIDGVPPEVSGFADIDGEGDHIVTGGNHESGVFIYESTDGGESWEMTFTDESCGSGCEIDGLEYVDSELAYAYGYGNTLIRFSGR